MWKYATNVSVNPHNDARASIAASPSHLPPILSPETGQESMGNVKGSTTKGCGDAQWLCYTQSCL